MVDFHAFPITVQVFIQNSMLAFIAGLLYARFQPFMYHLHTFLLTQWPFSSIQSLGSIELMIRSFVATAHPNSAAFLTPVQSMQLVDRFATFVRVEHS